MSHIIRKATKNDAESIHKLIIELAVYEREPNAVKTTPQQLIEDGFSENPFFHAYVLELTEDGETKVVGMMLYFFQYSTWEGKVLFLEDLIINEKYRGRGYGKEMLHVLAKEAQQKDCKRFQWQCLQWNEPSIKFYESIGSKELADWRVWRMNETQLKAFIDSENS